MPSHHYQRVPIEDSAPPSSPQNLSYFTGLPSTAPPSFHSVELKPSTPNLSPPLPHRNDETAATLIPHKQHPSPIPFPRPQTSILESESMSDDGGISLWGPSEEGSSSSEEGDSKRDEILVRLMDRMEAMERHFAAMPMIGKEEIDLEAAKERVAKKKWWSDFWQTLAVTLFMIWFLGVLGTTVVLSTWPKHSGNGGLK
ncbi:hypothetical protein L207DRAFT_507502 [Hyaloscypha variabilis F]|uniref:Transmembrane protein n=1 Tax=Hyaloscypha variabilis (strain UAMH 11265 / GT02V1 / F) TaxID=1149755 RepID=A0A2J6S758_HYAVF|nr:hypothetical protein L207DRAFT_507502 [Hyaloscypha variabilis F]